MLESASSNPASGAREGSGGDPPPARHPSSSPRLATDPRAARILARSIFRDMQSYGVPSEQVLEVAAELIALVTSDLGEPGR